jgi:hypothetical protein
VYNLGPYQDFGGSAVPLMDYLFLGIGIDYHCFCPSA